MRIFLSYASENRARAEEIALAMKGGGHDVFFDTDALRGGEDYNRVIRAEINQADLFVFLISPYSLDAGSYTLTELRAVQERWPHPGRRVLPVLLEPTDMKSIPAYLRAVTIFQPAGNVAAELAAHVTRRPRRWPRPLDLGGIGVAVLAIAVATKMFIARDPTEPPAFENRIAESAFVTGYVLRAEHVERTEYTLDHTARFPTDRGDVVTVNRIAFGKIMDREQRWRESGWSLRVRVTNPTDEPIQLDLTPRFFELADDQGRTAELQFFCCEAREEVLGPRQHRELHLVYRSLPGWAGKGRNPRRERSAFG